jgi:iron(III)-enterobactin esterase
MLTTPRLSAFTRCFATVSLIGLLAHASNGAEPSTESWVMAGERTAAALKAKGYNHRYVFSLATGHCDRRVFEQTLADTLVWTWRGYRAD